MGGFVIQKYLEEQRLPRRSLVFTITFWALSMALKIARRHPLTFAKVNPTLSLFPVISTPHWHARRLFARMCPKYSLVAYWKQDAG